ncbi:hypothetical protein, partial [Vibrio cholerae]|uniref:hypothetical protein n=1 Tax=Vibrio cholerae TaxID=666 RepID=UPI001C409263
MKSKKQKILYVITKGNWGGAQRYVFDLAVSLSNSLSNPLSDTGVGTGGSHLKNEGFEVAVVCG